MADWSHVADEGLAVPAIAVEARGRGVRVGIVDTGVRFAHPHLLLPPRGRAPLDDRVGHGTCCAALVHLLAPEAELYAVCVTNERGTTDASNLARGIDAAVEDGAEIVLVALGASSAEPIDEAVARASARRAVVVAADPRQAVFPARSPGAVGVAHREGVDVALDGLQIVAEGRARPVPGDAPKARNFWGTSLAAARAAAALARFQEATGERGDGLVRGFKKALFVL
jgi:subtilisin